MPAPPHRRALVHLAHIVGLCCAVGSWHCGHPCRDLSESICNCMPSQSQQMDCRRRVQAIESQRPASPDDKAGDAVCAQLLETCSCEALARGDFAACGLATE